ncbi:sigma-70 family RNA polymerase sigma factor [Nocardioides sp. CCNWLW212]|uniref:sigma-70 family RNA polymerase sigma factor n=2 Tax=unclassified Nocardioides TaxID=2615069 RepID=UPI00307D339A
MTAFLEPDHATSDLDLIGRARQADRDAIEELYLRHREPALRYARSLTDPVTAEDVVAESFARVLETLRAGGGPTLAFRPYLLRTVRNVHVTHVRGDSRFVWVEDEAVPDDPLPRDEAAERQESTVLASAFSSLPERWQAVLWHTAVEDDDHATVGRLLGIKANAVAALGFRARDGLRKAYLSAHLAAVRDEACRPYREQLAPYVRGRLRRETRADVERHLDGCADCSAGVLELGALNSQLGAVLAPALLGASATGYAAAATAAATGGWAGLVASLGRRFQRFTNPAVAAGAAAVTAVAAVAVTALVVTSAPEAPPEAAPPPAASARPTAVPPPADPAPAATPPRTRPERPSPAAVVVPVVDPEPPAPATTPASPTPTPSPTPTGSPSPKPTRSPTRPAVPVPTPTAKPSPSPTYASTEDLSLTAGLFEYFGPHHHVEMVVTAPIPAVVTLDVRGYQSHTMHTDVGFPTATCTPGPTVDDRTVLTCPLEPGTGVLAVDLVVSTRLDLRARIAAPGNGDPQPENDTWTYLEG